MTTSNVSPRTQALLSFWALSPIFLTAFFVAALFLSPSPVSASVIASNYFGTVPSDLDSTGTWVVSYLGTGLTGTLSSISAYYSGTTGVPNADILEYPDSSYSGALNDLATYGFNDSAGLQSAGSILTKTNVNKYPSGNFVFNSSHYYALYLWIPNNTASDIQLWGGSGSYPTAELDGTVSLPYSTPFFEISTDSTYSGAPIETENAPFYSAISNLSSGYTTLYDGTSTSADSLKTLPEDWIVEVASTTDSIGSPIVSDGYEWYQVTDPADGVTGWMPAINVASTTQYLPYYVSQQTALEASSTDFIATSSRPSMISGAVDHYYNNADTFSSLYSSDDDGNSISSLKSGDYPEALILGIAAQEDDGSVDGYSYGFNNEDVSSDYGHGIMQITFDPGSWDNRGIASDVTIPVCAAVESSLYTNCYTDVDSTVPYLRNYEPYGGNPTNPTYEEYTNTPQSIYANIKDGLQILANKYSIYSYITTSTTTDGITFSADDRKTILATQDYNGGCGYVNDIASTTDMIDSYFPTATSSDITDLLYKMHVVGDDDVCADLHSPGDLSIESSQGSTAGVVNGQVVNTFPLAVVDKDQKFVDVLGADTQDGYQFKVQGTKAGTYGLDITFKNGDKLTTFMATDIPILSTETHTYTIDSKTLATGQGGVTLQVSQDGNGTVSRTIETGDILTGAVYDASATPQELKAAAIGDIPDPVLVIKKNQAPKPKSTYQPSDQISVPPPSDAPKAHLEAFNSAK